MSDEKTDRRIQRTRELLRKALMELIDEKGYDAVTIQDITERANLGRTTFYLHYQSKEDLFLDHRRFCNIDADQSCEQRTVIVRGTTTEICRFSATD